MVEAVEALMLVHGSVLPKENRRTGQLPTGTVEIRKQNEQECFDVKPTEKLEKKVSVFLEKNIH